MKNRIIFILAAIMMAGCLCACAGGKAVAGESEKLQIVTTIFPEYDWVMNILGDNPANAEVTMLLDNGVDLHSYQPTADDIVKISTCDLFIYVGGESDKWVDDVLKGASNKNMAVINLLDVLGSSVKEEEVIEGMQEEEHDHDHEDSEEDDHDDDDDDHDHDDDDDDDDHDHDHEDGEPEYDEHVWLSLRNAAVLTDSIAKALEKADGKNADTYETNAKAYVEKLNALDKKYKDAVSDASTTTLLFGDRFPFRYLVDDYGLSYYAAFVGCSSETEASFETVAFLAQKVDELSLHSVMTIEGTDHRIAETIIQSTVSKDQRILTMDSLQSTTAKDVENGTTYLSVMEKNLSVLTQALE